ncbi:hypothetical protein [Actinomadura madurae]|uniref:hypothetical protein n=1 Tax=Actinomadura madurae TaxID=1993 RepID=UPI0027E358B6|nr:hypothetical protein [Actinomadura madurae]
MTITGAVSRASLAEAKERLEAVLPSADLARLGGDLFAVLHLVDREHGLRRAVSDPARDGADKAQLVQILLEGKVSPAALGLVADVVRLRWSKPSELSDAVEALAVTAESARAEADGRIDDLEDELFRFSRVIEGSPSCAAPSPPGPARRAQARPGERAAGRQGHPRDADAGHRTGAAPART